MLLFWNYFNHTRGKGGHENLNVLSHSHIATHLALSTIPDVQWCYVSGEKKKKKKNKEKVPLIILW